jgi:histidine ammonia-lyase
VLAVELLTSAQALDFRLPLKPGTAVFAAQKYLRSRIPHAHKDYEVRNDIELCASILREGTLIEEVQKVIGSLN